ncbi:MAG: 2-amino-4-hydroxy-6-hydroxymethyldihydropteridine diphosphokinase [Gemmatimonadetes bacterium]|nr:2-amino-4-hydroxy-6-hydroxymethyldihydropteridine diphosphokinase [Gemmatimonadota bacterium]MYB55298.1 2-amino-4-hydroxy-6-hydroxymethyldihydropteridine diphosphokinase [Gemmatimonadota bacterium]
MIYIGIGANLGDREKTLQDATGILNEKPEIAIIAASAVYETAPIGVVDQPYFLNAVLQVHTSLSARSLLNCLLAIERKFGRLRETRWGPRTLDLDILLYGDAIINQPGLQVPHPHLHERAFVLVPLCDLKPDLKHPVLGQSIQFLTKSLGRDLPVRKIEGLNLIMKK